jgi:tetratricopeptide (TPR) repeat protein
MSDSPHCPNPNCQSPNTTYKKKAGKWECEDCEQRFDSPGEVIVRPQRIFLSYGHDDNTPLVDALHDRLEAAGHQVWIDKAQIKVGDDWRLAIKQGLLESDRVLSFLSKHSTRDPGVCLDEIGIALAHRHGAIATLLVEPIQQVSPPPSIAHIQFLDLSNWREERDKGEPHWSQWLDAQAVALLDVIAKNTGFAGKMDELQKLLTPLSHGARLGSLVDRGFVGRDWLFQSIDDWRSQTAERTFWLVAEPGMGKSALAARLAHTTACYTVAYHFCRFDEPSTRSPETFVCTLAFQLAARLPGYRELVLHAARYPSKPLPEQRADDLFTLLLANPLRYSIDGGQSEDRLLVIVDALDEAPAIAELLARRQSELPGWVALLLTSRPDTQIQSALAGVAPHALNTNDPRNQDDLAVYVDKWFATINPVPAALTRATLLERSEGNILYLATARAGVANKVFLLDHPDALPKGLGGLYKQWFDRQFGGDTSSLAWQASYGLLELVCASPEPLPIAIARQTLNWVGQNKVAATRPLGSLIQEHDGVIELFHRSLPEWLQDPVAADRYWVNVEDGRVKLATSLWRRLPTALTAKAPEYLHRVLPQLLLAISIVRRHEVWGLGEDHFTLIDQIDDSLSAFNEHKMQLARVDLTKMKAEEFISLLGETSEQALGTLSKLANLLRDTVSDFVQSRTISERVLALREKSLGPDHPDTATSLNNLAVLLRTVGDFAAARPLYERALAIREKILGSDHPDTGTCLSSFANLLYEVGDYSGARPLYERALAVREKSLGPDHPDTATSLNNLAVLLDTLGDYAVARPLHERALAIREKTLGPDHLDTARSLSNLAILLVTTGEYTVARPLHERALAIREKTLGSDHPETAQNLDNIATLLGNTGDFSAARPLHERALTICEETLGPDHPATAQNLQNLAISLGSAGDYSAARPLLERSLAIRKKSLGLDHTDAASSLKSLAWIQSAMGDYAAARPLYEQALSVYENVLGPDHPDTGKCLSSFARLLETVGDHASARPLYERALAICENKFGPDHPATAKIVNNLARVLNSLGDYAAARPQFERVLTSLEQSPETDHFDTLLNLHNFCDSLREEGLTSEVEPLLHRLLHYLMSNYGSDVLIVTPALIALGELLLSKGERDEAICLVKQAYDIRLRELGPDDEKTILAKRRLNDAKSAG